MQMYFDLIHPFAEKTKYGWGKHEADKEKLASFIQR